MARPELWLVVVLDDQAVTLGRPRQQGTLPLAAHAGTAWAMVRWRHHHHIGRRRGIDADGGQTHALRVNRLRQQARPGHRKDGAHIGVAGLLHRNPPPLSAEQLADQIQRLLGADRHQNLVRSSPYAAPWQHPGAQLFDQIAIILVATIHRPGLDAFLLGRAFDAFPPVGQREQPGIDLTIDKGVAIAVPVLRIAYRAIRYVKRAEVTGPVGWRQ